MFVCDYISLLVFRRAKLSTAQPSFSSPASPGEAQLPRMVAVRDILLDALSWSKSSLREKVSIHMVKKAISELLGLMVYMLGLMVIVVLLWNVV